MVRPRLKRGDSGDGASLGILDDSDDTLRNVYLQRRAELTRYFRARLGSQEAANDVVQDIYLRLRQRAPGPVDNPAAYLFRLGRNVMLDRLKQEHRSAKRDADWRESVTTTLGDDSIDPSRAVDDTIAARQRLRDILDLVNTLSPAVREAFRLHKIEGFSHSETAKMLSVSRSSVEKYIMTCLRLILSKSGESDHP